MDIKCNEIMSRSCTPDKIKDCSKIGLARLAALIQNKLQCRKDIRDMFMDLLGFSFHSEIRLWCYV